MNRFPKYLLWILLLFAFHNSYAYTHKKAILLVDKDLQPDSLGYNFVTDVATNLYDWISSGKVILWDSPEKKSTLSFLDLKSVEAKSMASFKRLSNVFIYEYWTSQNRETSVAVSGISLNGYTFKGGKDVIYGYVEFNPALRELFQNTLLHVTANGNSETTLYTALINMGFNYTLIYFGNTPLVTNKSSNKIVADAFRHKKYLNKLTEKQVKIIEYGWDSTSMEQVRTSNKTEKILDNFFNNNQQEFFNYGGDQVYSFLKNVQIHISDFQVIETWTRDNTGKVFFTPQSIVLYAKGVRLQPIPFEKLSDWKLQYDNASLTAFLSEKTFPYEIRKINETMIPGTLALSYKDALFAFPWNHIIMKQ